MVTDLNKSLADEFECLDRMDRVEVREHWKQIESTLERDWSVRQVE